MYRIEKVHCDSAIRAVVQANIYLMTITVGEAIQLREGYGKRDTLGLDAIPEITISDTLSNFDSRAILITEESAAPDIKSFFSLTGDVKYQPTVYLSDPTDRSSQLKSFLEAKAPHIKVGEALEGKDTLLEWEERHGAPASITGACSAITCIRHGVPICAAIVNFITQELFLACKSGVFCYTLPNYKEIDVDDITMDAVTDRGQKIYFHSFSATGSEIENMRNYVTYLGKDVYQKNFRDARIMTEPLPPVYDLPGGPTRPLYLSTLAEQKPRVGFVLANGEKIGEWIHWMPFFRFGRKDKAHVDDALRLYEISQERPWTRDGVLMATSAPYSIFKVVQSETSIKPEMMIVNLDRFLDFNNPSVIRATLLLAPNSNKWVNNALLANQFRRIEFLRV